MSVTLHRVVIHSRQRGNVTARVCHKWKPRDVSVSAASRAEYWYSMWALDRSTDVVSLLNVVASECLQTTRHTQQRSCHPTHNSAHCYIQRCFTILVLLVFTIEDSCLVVIHSFLPGWHAIHKKIVLSFRNTPVLKCIFRICVERVVQWVCWHAYFISGNNGK